MPYHLAASAVAVLHLAFVVFVITGGAAVYRWPRLLWLHAPSAAWGALIELGGWSCPLTRLETWLLRQAGEAGYADGFVAHYIFAALYPAGLTRGVELLLGAAVILINAAAYTRLRR
jgi:hypothetical protein